MGVSYYDEALANKIQKWIKDPKITVLKPDQTQRLFSIRADQNNDKPITLPLIALSRDNRVSILAPNKKTMSYDGLMVKAEGGKSIQINAIPISISYQLDIYTRTLEEADAYARDFVFNLINHSKVTIEIPYNNLKYHHDSYIVLSPEINDNSDIPQKLFPDQFTRFTLNLTIPDAYLFSASIENLLIIDEPNVEVKD